MNKIESELSAAVEKDTGVRVEVEWSFYFAQLVCKRIDGLPLNSIVAGAFERAIESLGRTKLVAL